MLIENARLKDGWRSTWLPVSSLIKYDTAIIIYKMTSDLCPENSDDDF